MKHHFHFYLKILLYIGILGGFLTFVSCKNRNSIEHQTKRIIGNEIIIPNAIQPLIHGKDTILTDFLRSTVKLIVFFDSLECSSCQINRMNEWKEFTKYAQTTKNKFNIYFIFPPRQSSHYQQQVRNSLRVSQLNYPVFLDKNSNFIRSNTHIPKDKRLHVFLLDENNRVVLVGDPRGNTSLWELYINQIQTILNKTAVI